MIIVEFDEDEISKVPPEIVADIHDADLRQFVVVPEDIEELREKEIKFTIIKII